MEEPKVYKIQGKSQIELEVSDLGASILSLKVPDKHGELVNVVVGLNSLSDYMSEEYLKQGLYLGSTVGRHAGRISGGELKIEGEEYPLYHELGVHLHGGKEGFDKKIWRVDSIVTGDTPSITFSYLSPHLEEGYPGNLNISVTYRLSLQNEVIVSYRATTDQTSVLNVTNHSYFNLNGDSTILDHELELNADSYLELDDNLIPTGGFNKVEGGLFDYRNRSEIGKNGFNGLDDIFRLNEGGEKAFLSSARSGIQMTVKTDQPAMVIYTPPKFDELPFKDNAQYSEFPAICFEAQGYPDALNNCHFPSTLIRPGELFESTTSYGFSIV